MQHHRAWRRAAWAVLALAACGGDDDGGAGQPDAARGARTLATCTTSIAADVPAFYQQYFRCVTVTRTATGVAIATEDLPPHPSYYYGSASPNYAAFDTSRGAGYHPNPNTLAAQTITIAVPDAPVYGGVPIDPSLIDATAGTSSLEYALGPVGVATDSVALFTGTAAPGDDIAAERFTFDSYSAHPEQRGAYHYHSPTPGPLEVLAAAGAVTSTVPGAAEVEVYGVMCDGTIVLGCTELDGSAPAAGLDAQGGHRGDLRDTAGTLHFTDRYHVHVCADAARGHAYTPEIHYYGACAR